MKKIYIILICIIISLSLVSCSSNSKAKDNDNSVSFTQKTTDSAKNADSNSDNEESITGKPLDDGSDIEKVKLSFLNSTQESTYDETAKILIENIKTCEDNESINLTKKIGTLSVKQSKDKEFSDIANLYLGVDNNVYAKYIDKSNNESNYAYQIDLDKMK